MEALQIHREKCRLPRHLHRQRGSPPAAGHPPRRPRRQVTLHATEWQAIQDWPLSLCSLNDALLLHPPFAFTESRLRWSGGSPRRASGFECRFGPVASSQSRWWSGQTALCLSSGKVRTPVEGDTLWIATLLNMVFVLDGPKDTSPEDTLEKTYAPSLKTLEEEVMEKMGIQENRKHQRSYWY